MGRLTATPPGPFDPARPLGLPGATARSAARRRPGHLSELVLQDRECLRCMARGYKNKVCVYRMVLIFDAERAQAPGKRPSTATPVAWLPRAEAPTSVGAVDRRRLEQAAGRRDQLLGTLQRCSGSKRDRADRDLDELARPRPPRGGATLPGPCGTIGTTGGALRPPVDAAGLAHLSRIGRPMTLTACAYLDIVCCIPSLWSRTCWAHHPGGGVHDPLGRVAR